MCGDSLDAGLVEVLGGDPDQASVLACVPEAGSGGRLGQNGLQHSLVHTQKLDLDIYSLGALSVKPTGPLHLIPNFRGHHMYIWSCLRIHFTEMGCPHC